MKKNVPTTRLVPMLLVALLLSVTSMAQTMMPLPNHNTVYSGSARGYWFIAPVDFTITGLRVPSQAGTGGQYIHVMELHTTPPIAFTAQSTNFTTLTYISNAANGVIQSVNIQVTAGDVIGIMGTAGTGNSYATGAYTSNIGGQSVSLSRLGYQGHITGAGGAPQYWGVAAGASGSISRVEMYYTVGPPCAGATNLNITNVNSVAASFNWTAPASTQGYEYAVTPTPANPTSGVTATTQTNGSVTGLTPATQYYLQVRNQCQSGSWSKWDTLSFTTLDSCSVPTGFNVFYVDSNSANIGWSAVLTANTYQFIIDQSRATPISAAGATSTTNNTLSLTGLTEGTTYYIHVRSLCNGDDSSGWMLDSFYVPIPCRAPQIKITNISTSQGVASWNNVLSATGYEYALTESPAPPPFGTAWPNTSYYLPYLDDGKSYYFHVRTHCNDKGVISNSDWGTVSFETTPVGIVSVGNAGSGVNVYPNPVTNTLNVDIENEVKQGARFELVDITGRVVLGNDISDQHSKISVVDIPSGVYLLKLYNGDNIEVVKITKE